MELGNTHRNFICSKLHVWFQALRQAGHEHREAKQKKKPEGRTFIEYEAILEFVISRSNLNRHSRLNDSPILFEMMAVQIVQKT